MGKKGKGKKVEYLTDKDALAPFDVDVDDMIATPLGVFATVIGVREGSLWLKWPGGIESPASPAPAKAKNKQELETFGYNRRPQSAHIQRSIDTRLRVTSHLQRVAPRTPRPRDLPRWSRGPFRAPAHADPPSMPLLRRHNTSRGATEDQDRARPQSNSLSDRAAASVRRPSPPSPTRAGQ